MTHPNMESRPDQTNIIDVGGMEGQRPPYDLNITNSAGGGMVTVLSYKYSFALNSNELRKCIVKFSYCSVNIPVMTRSLQNQQYQQNAIRHKSYGISTCP